MFFLFFCLGVLSETFQDISRQSINEPIYFDRKGSPPRDYLRYHDYETRLNEPLTLLAKNDHYSYTRRNDYDTYRCGRSRLDVRSNYSDETKHGYVDIGSSKYSIFNDENRFDHHRNYLNEFQEERYQSHTDVTNAEQEDHRSSDVFDDLYDYRELINDHRRIDLNQDITSYIDFNMPFNDNRDRRYVRKSDAWHLRKQRLSATSSEGSNDRNDYSYLNTALYCQPNSKVTEKIAGRGKKREINEVVEGKIWN